MILLDDHLKSIIISFGKRSHTLKLVVNLIKVPAHTNIPLNEEVDRLAKLGSMSPYFIALIKKTLLSYSVISYGKTRLYTVDQKTVGTAFNKRLN